MKAHAVASLLLAWLLVACSKAPATSVSRAAVFTPTAISTVAPVPPQTRTPTASPTPIDLEISSSNAAKITELARLGRGVITQVLWSPDGKVIAVATSTGVYLFAADTLNLRTFIETGTSVTSAAFASDGRTLAVSDGYPNTTVHLWDASTGQLIRALKGHAGSVNSVALNSQGSTLVSGSDDGTIRLWNIQTGQTLRTLDAGGSRVQSVVFSRDGHQLVSGSRDGAVQLWSPTSGDLLKSFITPGEYPVVSVATSPDGQYIASGGNDYKVTLREINTGEILFSGEHTDIVNSLAFSPDGHALASGSDDGSMRIWSVPSGNLLQTLTDHANSIKTVAYTQDGRILLSGSTDGTVRLWDTETYKGIDALAGFSNWLLGVAVSPDGRTIAANGWKTVQLWNVDASQPETTLEAGVSWVESIAFSPNGRYLASLGCAEVNDESGYCLGSEAIIWDVATGQVARTIHIGEHSDESVKVTFSPDGSMLATASGGDSRSIHPVSDKVVKLWDTDTGQLIHTMGGYIGLSDIAFSPDGKFILSSVLQEIWVTHINTGDTEIKLASAHFVQQFALNPNGEILATGMMTGNAGGLVQISEVKTGRPLRLLATAKPGTFMPQIDCIAFSPNGRLLAAGDSDGFIHLWDTETWDEIAKLSHTAIVTGLIFSADGSSLISSSFDGTVRVWGIKP